MQTGSSSYKMIQVAKVLIFFSAILFFIGIFLDFNNQKKYVDPITGVIQSEHNETIVSVDTSNNDDNDAGSIVISDDNDNANDNANGNSNVLNNDVSDSNGRENHDTNSSASVVSLEDINEVLKKEIEESYGISIMYGGETEGYSIKYLSENISTVPISDSVLVNSSLNRLKASLELYPIGLFNEINDGGIPLTIILIDSFSDKNITGITDSNYTSAAISIAVSYPFEETFYHESYHYIERYLFKMGASYSSWDILNPRDFKYSMIYKDLSYANTFSEEAFFVNTYAQTDDKEDRASTFEYMMASTKASCLNNGNPIWKKAVLISRTMEAVLDTVSPNTIEYWERFLY